MSTQVVPTNHAFSMTPAAFMVASIDSLMRTSESDRMVCRTYWGNVRRHTVGDTPYCTPAIRVGTLPQWLSRRRDPVAAQPLTSLHTRNIFHGHTWIWKNGSLYAQPSYMGTPRSPLSLSDVLRVVESPLHAEYRAQYGYHAALLQCLRTWQQLFGVQQFDALHVGGTIHEDTPAVARQLHAWWQHRQCPTRYPLTPVYTLPTHEDRHSRWRYFHIVRNWLESGLWQMYGLDTLYTLYPDEAQQWGVQQSVFDRLYDDAHVPASYAHTTWTPVFAPWWHTMKNMVFWRAFYGFALPRALAKAYPECAALALARQGSASYAPLPTTHANFVREIGMLHQLGASRMQLLSCWCAYRQEGLSNEVPLTPSEEALF